MQNSEPKTVVNGRLPPPAGPVVDTLELLDLTAEAVSVHDAANGLVLYANRPAGEQLRLQAGRDFAGWKDDVVLHMAWTRALAGHPLEVEWMAGALAGGRWYEVRLTRVGFAGSPAVMATWSEVTKRREAVEALRRATEALARAAQGWGATPMASATPSDPPTGTVHWCPWTGRLEDAGEWVTLKEFLARHLHLELTDGISDQAVATLKNEARVLEALRVSEAKEGVQPWALTESR